MRVCGFARAHIYIHTHTHAGETKRDKEREREYERESERLLQREKRFLLIILLFFILHAKARDKNPKHPMSQFFLSFFLPEKHLKGETHSFSLWILTH